MGAADVVPGVSGGTIAFISGIYDRLLGAISQFNLGLFKVLKADGFAAVWKKVDGTFLLTLFAGIFTSILSLSKVITHLMATQPVLVWSFFCGLVLASIVYVGKQISTWDTKALLGLLVGALVVLGVSFLPPMTNSENLFYIFICGAIAICAMILPGVSGSLLLLILGAYSTVLGAIHERNIVLIGVFMAGAVTGLLSFSRFLKWLLEKYRNTTLAVLTGFLVGSLWKLWPWKKVLETFVKHKGEANEELVTLVDTNVLPGGYDTDPQSMYALAFVIIGFVLIFGIEYLGNKAQAKK